MQTGKSSFNNSITQLVEKINSMDLEEALIYQNNFKYNVIKSVLEFSNENYNKYSSKNFYYILNKRFRKSTINILYQTLLNKFDNYVFIETLRERLDQLNDYETYDSEFVTFLVTNYSKEKDIYDFMRLKNNSLLSFFKNNKISSASRFYELTIASVLVNGEKEDFEQITKDFIFEQSLLLGNNNFYKFINNYFSHYNLDKQYFEYIKKVVDKYGDPFKRNPHHVWTYVNDNIKNSIRRMINEIKVDNAFGNDERSRFWKGKIDNIDNVIHSKTNKLLIMYFNGFVVVEFIPKGNAAYFYNVNVFEELFSKTLDKIELDLPVYNGSLKEKIYDKQLGRYKVDKGIYNNGSPNNTVIHGNNWQRKMNKYLQLKGVN
ncbi:MAG: hypothetical protein JEZ08_01885 [Clostridiales bacterium]|nr:hypothetical protein [Clostridiales bacterium]